MSSASSARSALDGFVAGRVPAARAVATVAAVYYGLPVAARDPLRDVVAIMEREAPGIVELTRAAGGAGGPGFAITPVQRPFPAAAEGALRDAARALLATGWGVEPAGATPRQAVPSAGGWWARLLRTVRSLLSAGS